MQGLKVIILHEDDVLLYLYKVDILETFCKSLGVIVNEDHPPIKLLTFLQSFPNTSGTRFQISWHWRHTNKQLVCECKNKTSSKL